MGMLNISKPTAVKAFKELTKASLIIEERQGLNKPNKIYICRMDYGGKNFYLKRLTNLTLMILRLIILKNNNLDDDKDNSFLRKRARDYLFYT